MVFIACVWATIHSELKKSIKKKGVRMLVNKHFVAPILHSHLSYPKLVDDLSRNQAVRTP
jgi:hypothetical protein